MRNISLKKPGRFLVIFEGSFTSFATAINKYSVKKSQLKHVLIFKLTKFLSFRISVAACISV